MRKYVIAVSITTFTFIRPYNNNCAFWRIITTYILTISFYAFLMFQRRTQLSPMIVSIMIQTRDKVLITHDLPIAVNSNPLKVFITTFIFIRPYKKL